VSRVEGLVRAYARFVRQPWEATLAGPERVWFALYDPEEERRLRFRLDEFAMATKQAGHGWSFLDLADDLGRWLGGHRYARQYFERPQLLRGSLKTFEAETIGRVRAALAAPEADANAVVALGGVAGLFGLMRVSALIEAVAPDVRGRLLVFFPGHKDGPSYRLLDARDGWNYLAVPITADAD